MKNKLLLSLLYELLWFVFAAVAAYLLILPVKNEISQQFFIYLLWSLFLVFTYFRFTAFMMRSIILENVWTKIMLFIANIPLFFFVIDQYYSFGRVYDEYNFTLADTTFQHIKSGADLKDLLYVKKLVTFSGISSVTLIVFMEARIVYAIFKLRQLDSYLFKKK